MSTSTTLNIIFISSNKNKVREVKSILADNLPIQIIPYEVDLLEFQSEDPDDITRAKCIEALRIISSDTNWIATNLNPKTSHLYSSSLNQCQNTQVTSTNPSTTLIMIEDTALNFDAWGGSLPGPYIKWFIKSIGPHGLFNTLQAFPDKSATAVCTFAIYTKFMPETTIKLSTIIQCMTRGVIVEPRGDNGFGWDPCFEPDSGPNMNIPLNDARRLTFAQMPSSQKNSISHRSKALLNLRNYLIKKYFSK
ncbi:inosine triphosphate pyrophosphatase-like [Gordionus sp. m RMFG-2023]|uniref:inosine triphosphate pyrophosphatase-like n=1 Tax=Gordionus sp. m RMFG-2023 TaxID=3053472 RepID=UPI0031FDF0FF